MKKRPESIVTRPEVSPDELLQKYRAVGPVFDRPSRKNHNRLLIVASIIIPVILIGTLVIKNEPENSNNISNTEQNTDIHITVKSGDSYTKVARRAITIFSEAKPELNITNPERLFMETWITRSAADKNVSRGQSISFSVTTLMSAYGQSQKLTASQLDKWAQAAKNINF